MKNQTPKVTRKSLLKALETLLESGAYKATVYQHPRLVVTATRRYGKSLKSRTSRRESRIDVALKIGAPNYEERQFVKVCQRVGEPFPVRRVRLRMPRPKKRT